MDGILLIPILLPIIAGIILLILSFSQHRHDVKVESERNVHIFTACVLTVSIAVAMLLAWTGDRTLTLFHLVDDIPIYFKVDGIGKILASIVSIVWFLAGIFSFDYMKHEGDEKRYFGFFLMLYGVLIGLDFSGNLVTTYFFYELMTLVSMPLVLHNQSREAIMASLKYLFYSMCGAYAGLFGIFTLYRYSSSLGYVAGGSIDWSNIGTDKGMVLVAIFAMIIGFGAKAGMFPLHAWLPTAHPVAPSPASACLSGIIVKAGVLAIIRTIYYVVGPSFLRGTWVQYAWMTLALITVFMGSLLAFREKVFKKRLAYSTVSQISYILFGLSVMTTTGFQGALLHTVAHALIKCGLFLTAGVFLYCFGYSKVEQLKGIGKKMPLVIWCYTFFALALIGIPPTSGFISKWYLAQGALESGIPVFSWFGVAVLLVSALLTAGYLLPITMKGFFPGEGDEKYEKVKVPVRMQIALVGLAVLAVGIGLFPNPLIDFVADLATRVLG